MCMCDKKVL